MKLFLDTANLEDIREAVAGGFIRGVTTNPSLLAKEPKTNYLAHINKIVEILNNDGTGLSLSVEVFSDDPTEMVTQAKQFVKELKYKHLAVKIPVSYKDRSYLAVVRELSSHGIIVNCTACQTSLQLLLAAASGAKYVSLFYNRLLDGAKEEKYEEERKRLITVKQLEPSDFDPRTVLRETRELLALHYPQTEIIAGSIRTALDIKQAGLSGAHIVTASLNIIKEAAKHFKTDHAVETFMSDFKSWMS